MRLTEIPKNKLLYDSENDKTVLIKDCIHYPGEERFKVILSYGFGAGEVNEIIYVNEHEVDKFLKRFIKEKEVKELKKILKDSIVENVKQNDLSNLREDLFKSIKGVVDGTMKIEQAKTISSTAQVIVNSFKVEIEYKKLIKDFTPIKM